MNKYGMSVLLLLSALVGFPAMSQVVNICNDNAEWPPYTFHPRDNGKADKSSLVGASYDTLKVIFQQAGMKMEMKMIPWKRCLDEVQNYAKKGQFELFMDGSSNDERMSKYIRTEAFYQTNQGYLYSTKKFPSGPEVKKVSDLNKYKVCGIAGYNYETYMKNGLTAEIDTRAKSPKNVLQKLSAGRCDIFLSAIEPILGGNLVGQITFTPDIKYAVLNELPKTKFYAWVSKGSPRSAQLVETINNGLNKLKADGELDKIFKKYTATGTGF
ncbi:transporter substrate-binding domain-containing protein [Vibrio sp. S4M6]|uniref:substrate-binding periplasmic protein n=1 Tax=Vibrio sinus TaxID=2946865 RepID=UPI002029B956|nr:transporter substrate-binding domain-containing protein [Vibrio sinus]MCL9780923.1 transporter substrate-binding domain-containing protein [Vibrio sinus]